MLKSSNSTLSRRQMIEQGVALTGAMAASMALPQAVLAANEPLPYKSGSLILFQGDSITNCGRNRELQQELNTAASLGGGYPNLITAGSLLSHPDLGLRFYNRGISGNTAPQLLKRWQRDTINVNPNLLSILIGVNDYGGSARGPLERYKKSYHELLEWTRRELPDTNIVLIEPFVLKMAEVNDRWVMEFEQWQKAAKQVAETFDTMWIPFQGELSEATKKAPPRYWMRDGVHLSLAGHALLAKSWRRVVGI